MRLRVAHLTVLGAVVLHACAAERPTVLDELNAVAPSSRHYDVRLDGIEWKPLDSSDRPSRPYSLEALAARLSQQGSPHSDHQLALAWLLLGRGDQAREMLENVRHSSPDPAIERLYAAALVAASGDREDLRLCARALDVLEPFDDAASTFNRALALECIGLLSDAEAEWGRFLEKETDGPWYDEASEHRQKLVQLRTTRERARISDDDATLGAEQLERVARIFPERVFDRIFDVLLPEWGEAVLANDDATASERLEEANESAVTLRDPWVIARLVEIGSLSMSRQKALAEAYVRYGEGRAAYRSGKNTEAIERARSVAALSREADSDAAVLAQILEATCTFLRGDPSGVEAILLDEKGATSPIVAGRIGWLRGVAALTLGELATSIAHLETALHAFGSANATASEGAIQAFLGDVWEQVGWKERAWQARRDCFERLFGAGYDRYWHSGAISAVIAAAEEGYRDAGSRMARAIRANAIEGGDPELIASAGVWELLLKARGATGYQTLVGDISTAIAAIPEPAGRQRLTGFLMMAKADHDLAAARLDDSGAAAASAVTTFENLRAGIFLSAALTVSGVIEKSRGNLVVAQSRFERAAELRGEQETSVDDPVLGFIMKSGSFNLWHEWIDLLLRAGRNEEALAVVGRAYAREKGRADVADLVRASEGGERTIVVYWLRSPHLYRWIVDRGAIEFRDLGPFTLPEAGLGADALEDSRWLRQIARNLLPESGGAISGGTLSIVPGGTLYSVPWAALPVAGEPLVAAHDLYLAPDFSAAASDVRRTSRAEVAVVGAPRAEFAGADLVYLREVESEIRGIGRRLDRPVSIGTFPSSQPTGLFHFSGHAVATSASLNPLLLSGSESWTPADVSSRYAPALAVLAACESGSGTPGFDGPWSFARALLDRGTSAVIGTLWPIVDGRSRELLDDFYEALLDGEPAHVALSKAQRNSIRRGVPIEDWAPWIAIGSPMAWNPEPSERTTADAVDDRKGGSTWKHTSSSPASFP